MMKKFFYSIVAVLFLSVVMINSVNAQSSEGDSVISVDGYGTVTAIPDKAEISISILSEAREAKAAQQENAVIANKVHSALKALGISSGDMKTRNYSFNPVYSNEKNKPDRIVGYSASSTLVVTVNDIAVLGKVIDHSLSAGANKISGISFNVKKPESYRQEALKNALRDARFKAEVIAQELGVQIKGIKVVTENVGRISSRDTVMLAKSMGNMMDASTPVAVGELEISATVHIDFVI
ncbi:MAG: SIMPL domain-containing protein [Anaerovibrio sp.]|uniref:SIMPL domain-containing protein n=1 Tax=Anaerovibrio sp. TaxID=1872532 RepID=UPI0025D1BFF4|nr:SIMPL domain-containing protein [Anaerovibrio sp.]MCR5176051.1 SIMPL domain-containing protein [Anaerovibrio sp.]